MKTKVALFDLDGTLVHSAPDIAEAANRALRELGHPMRTIAQIQSFIGHGAEQLIHRCLTGHLDGHASKVDHAATYGAFQSHYAQCLIEQTRPYPQVLATLEVLSAGGIRLGCVTNKPQRFTTPLLRGLGLANYFEITLSGDSLATKKPSAEPLLHAALHCGVTPQDCVMVGDSMADLMAARAAGMRIFCVDYGYSGDADLSAHAPDALISSFNALVPLLLS